MSVQAAVAPLMLPLVMSEGHAPSELPVPVPLLVAMFWMVRPTRAGRVPLFLTVTCSCRNWPGSKPEAAALTAFRTVLQALATYPAAVEQSVPAPRALPAV